MMETNKSIRRHHEMHIYFELTSLTIGLIRIRHLECFHLTDLRRETYAFKKEKKKKGLLVNMDLATDVLLNTRKIVNLEMIKKITYKLLRVGGKVNGISPPMWLLLRSLCNCETESFMRLLVQIIAQLLVKS